MLVFGRNNDDKGSQLEALTLKLLKQKGYKNCTSNYISAGGSEVDARAEFDIPQLNGHVTREILCECKAHRSPIAMTDWQKFLGKVFSEEIIAGHEVAGTFIALSGVNGNVKGNYDELRRRKDNLSLITGDDLLSLLRLLFHLISIEEVTAIVTRTTQRVVKQIDIAYYDAACYWIVVFSGGSFCLLTANGKIVEGELVPLLVDLVGREVEVSDLVDLAKEAEAQKRIVKAQAWSLGRMMINGGELTEELLLEDSPFSKDEIEASLHLLAADDKIDRSHTGLRVILASREGVDFIPGVTYRAMLTGGCPLEAIGCDFYDCNINDGLLDHLLEIQCGVPLSASERSHALRILRISPTALVRLSEPLPMITTHRKDSCSEEWDKADRDILFHTLHESLTHDFMNKDLAQYSFKLRVLRELETRTQLILKTATDVIIDDTIHDRTAIAEFDDSLGGGFGHVRLLEHVPQPWEPGGIGLRPEEDAAS